MHMKKITFLLTAFVMVGLLSFAQGKDLSIDEFYAATKNNKRIQLIDVRTPGEFNSGHLINAENIDFKDRKFIEEAETLNKNKPTYIYCRSGHRSSQAMKAMIDAGFRKVYNLEGGIMAWQDAKLPTSNTAIDEHPVNLTMADFRKLTSGNTPVLVDFTAKWCGPCRILKPRIKELEKEKGDALKVIYIDIDKNKDLANDLGIRAIPLLHVYKNGKLKDESTGLISLRELRRMVK